jgi:hypothetical protein
MSCVHDTQHSVQCRGLNLVTVLSIDTVSHSTTDTSLHRVQSDAVSTQSKPGCTLAIDTVSASVCATV